MAGFGRCAKKRLTFHRSITAVVFARMQGVAYIASCHGAIGWAGRPECSAGRSLETFDRFQTYSMEVYRDEGDYELLWRFQLNTGSAS